MLKLLDGLFMFTELNAYPRTARPARQEVRIERESLIGQRGAGFRVAGGNGKKISRQTKGSTIVLSKLYGLAGIYLPLSDGVSGIIHHAEANPSSKCQCSKRVSRRISWIQLDSFAKTV